MKNNKDSNQKENKRKESPKAKEKGKVSKKVNLLEAVEAELIDSTPEIVRLGADETVVFPFTSDSEEVEVHYCSETDISSYILCNGDQCLLCRIGRHKDTKLLLPVYLPTSSRIGVLPVSRSLRPLALLPQISNVLKAKKPMVLFIVRDGAKFTVSSSEIPPDADGGEQEIKKFMVEYDAGQVDLTAVYPRRDDTELAQIEEISKMIKIKGIKLNGAN
tara:strand:+ start:162 stop:815 length:654 start_codon:yes stop_codon:yes gene_type:complete